MTVRQFHGLGHAAVAADDDVRAVFKEEVGDLVLLVGGLGGKLRAPGHEYEHDVSASLLRGGKVALHEVVVDLGPAAEVVRGADAGRVLKARDGDVVRVAGVGEEGDVDAVYVGHEAVAARVALFQRAIGADVVKARGVKRVQRVVYAVLVGVHAVAGRRVHKVEADLGDGRGQVGRGLEEGIGRVVGALGEGGHEGADGVVRVCNEVFEYAENGDIVIARVARGLAVQACVHDDVAADGESARDGVYVLGSFVRRLLGLFRGGGRVGHDRRGSDLRLLGGFNKRGYHDGGYDEHDRSRNSDEHYFEFFVHIRPPCAIRRGIQLKYDSIWSLELQIF